jgi:acyl dehydratase
VLDFWRCAMLPLREAPGGQLHDDDVEAIASSRSARAPGAAVANWRLEALAAVAAGPGGSELAAGMRWTIEHGDVVSGAPELARLTLNLAAAHHDRARPGGGGQRLVYGGHTIAIAAAQAARAIPRLATITGWHECDHLGPVHEGDTLFSRLEVESAESLRGTGGLARLRSRVRAVGADRAERDVLDWRFVAVVA